MANIQATERLVWIIPRGQGKRPAVLCRAWVDLDTGQITWRELETYVVDAASVVFNLKPPEQH